MDDFLSTIKINKRTKKVCAMCPKNDPDKPPTEFLAQAGEIWCKKCKTKAQKLDHQSYKVNYNGDNNG